MTRVRRSRVLGVPLEQVWEVVADAHHQPRWWPGVQRMEGVSDEAFTQVHLTKKGRPVRIDFTVVDSETPHRRAWRQEVEGTPFERVLTEALTEIQLEPEGERTKVTIELRQQLRGYSRTGGFMLRRASRRRLEEALQWRERACGGDPDAR
ncbi:MAG: SRPBCC family protein [Actinomycetota bacterium]|nr:SRPBCC family protein [Actinomycetota bacterium]